MNDDFGASSPMSSGGSAIGPAGIMAGGSVGELKTKRTDSKKIKVKEDG